MRIVLMGVSGCGKTVVGRTTAQSLNLRFVDADDYHPKCNVEKMRAGHPLNDTDRMPWLERVSTEIRHGDIVACSALKRRYRNVLRSVTFIHLDAPVEIIRERVAQRTHEFMPCTLLDSQYDALQPLGDGEGYVIDAAQPLDKVVADVVGIVRVLLSEEVFVENCS